ncbi:hypothetical protein AB0I66_05945 [Streptomyces sp. NPDC050439]|uniref:hypothetical protein n=1 Tax=unclassified Streptomyces TaxID=2593676 RepID=UPI00341AED89
MPTPADFLALARTESDSSVLHRLVRCPYPFVWQAVAANPHTPPAALLELTTARDSTWNDNRLLRLLAEHPRSDREEIGADEVQSLGALRGASARLRGLLARRLGSRVRMAFPRCP